jgi:hypothetical protein
MGKMDLIDIYGILCYTIADYIFFSTVHGTLSKIDNIINHKAYLNKYKKLK